eukprot:908550_1
MGIDLKMSVLLPLFDTVVQIAASFDMFSILVDAVVKAGLVEVLSGPGPQLADILLYHVIGDFILTPRLKQSITMRTLKPDGQTVKSVYGYETIRLIDAHSDVSTMGLADVKAKNGVAHVVDRILVPLFDSVVQVATSFKDYSILVTLVKSADMVMYLQG